MLNLVRNRVIRKYKLGVYQCPLQEKIILQLFTLTFYGTVEENEA
jgi:hypothetical protein